MRWNVPLDVVGLCVAVIALLGFGAYAIAQARKWLLEPTADPEDETPLEQYRQLTDDGLLDPQEYERIRTRLQAGESLDPPLAAPPPAPPPTDLPE